MMMMMMMMIIRIVIVDQNRLKESIPSTRLEDTYDGDEDDDDEH